MLASALLQFLCPVLSFFSSIQLKSPARSISDFVRGRACGRISGETLLSVFISTPDGAYTFIIYVPLNKAAITLPEGRHLMLDIFSPSLAKTAVLLPSVP
jgi:hypothetical protein